MMSTEGSTVVTSNAGEDVRAQLPPKSGAIPDSGQISPRNTHQDEQTLNPDYNGTTDNTDAANTSKHHEGNMDSVSPRDSSPLVGDDDEKLESSTDLQFKKKDFRKSRAQSFQSVLSTASLKSLKQQYTQGNPPQPLSRNHSTVSNMGTTNSKNFQSFIQAPVLSSVTNLRQADEIKIGQQLPFDDRTEGGVEFATSARHSVSQVPPVADNPQRAEEELHDDDDDIYREETTLQQQRLTINALKKLSLSLAPIIRSDDEETDLQPRQLTTKSLNGSVVPDSRLKTRPYQPAQVDLSSFSSLTRQSKHLTSPETNRADPTKGQASNQFQNQDKNQNQNQNLDPNQGQSQMHSYTHGQNQAPSQPQEQFKQSTFQGRDSLNQSQSADQASSANIHPSIPHNQERGRTLEKAEQRPVQQVSNSGPKSAAIPVNGFKPTFGNIEHTIGGRNVPAYPVVPPHDMNIRNRKVSLQHEPQPPPAKVPLPDKKLQQIKGFRSPMYVPAVLRRNHEDEVGPVSSNGSDSDLVEPSLSAIASPAKDTGSSATSLRSFDSAYSSESTSPSHSKTGPFTLNKRQYEYILRAAPTRKHWLKDETVVECGIGSCHKHFNFFERRHHCRKCGGIFCKEHTSHFLYINHLAQFTTGGRGTLSRVCDNCIEDYNEFIKNEFGVGTQTARCRESPPRVSAVATDFRKEIFKPKEPLSSPISPVTKADMNEQLVGSVPANWSWSSF